MLRANSAQPTLTPETCRTLDMEPVGHGRIWVVTIPRGQSSDEELADVMPYSVLAFLGNYCQAVGAFQSVQAVNGQPVGNHPYAIGFHFADAFIQSATSCRFELRMVACPDPEDGRGIKPGELVMHYHTRYLAADIDPDYLNDKRGSPIRPGIRLVRDRASIRQNYRPGSLSVDFINIRRRLIERVSSFSLSILNTVDAPYTIVVLMDDDMYPTGGEHSRAWRHSRLRSDDRFPDAHSPEANGLRPSGRCVGLSQFLLMALTMFELWETGWMSTLDYLDDVAAFSVGPPEFPVIST
ncbi:hypothetical protein B0I37DRAFT_167175 [Chaetomium sp. MPI-CAGE-AT-0009]|nr:hypothetical protein B0I37DRAFT_167175 [Chaetomium sp. MPI-CAGE-AT-0009]